MENINEESNFSIERNQRDSWKVMFDKLYTDIYKLYEKESLLIRTEMKEIASDAKKAASAMAIGGVFLFVGVFALVASAIILLSLVMPLWVSSLLVTAFLFVVGGVLVMSAKKKLSAEKLTPKQSIETFGEIKTTFKERINEFKYQH